MLLCLDCIIFVKDFGILRNERKDSTTGFICGDGIAGDLREGIAHCFILTIKKTTCGFKQSGGETSVDESVTLTRVAKSSTSESDARVRRFLNGEKAV